MVPEALELEGGLSLDAAGLAEPFEGERAHLLHALAALQLLGLTPSEAARDVRRRSRRFDPPSPQFVDPRVHGPGRAANVAAFPIPEPP